MSNQNLKNELFKFFTQFFKTIDFLKIPDTNTFSFIPEWIELFEKLGFPDWYHHYSSFENMDKSLLSFVKNPEQEVFQDLSDLDEAEKNSQISKRLEELVTNEQRQSKEPFINDEQAKIIFGCYALLNFGLLGAVYGENPFKLFKKAEKGERESILKVIQVDKSLIGTEWSMREIKKAHLSGDEDYLNQLSKAIIAKPYTPKKKDLKLSIFLLYGWESGLNELTNLENFDLAKELDIYESDDPGSLDKLIYRWGYRKGKNSKT
jgi:hypothetical protein